MEEQWGKQAFAARRHYEDTTRGAAFTYTNSNHTKGTVLSFYQNNLVDRLTAVFGDDISEQSQIFNAFW